LRPSEQLSPNINVGLVFWQLQRSKNANYSAAPAKWGGLYLDLPPRKSYVSSLRQLL
jgi:hypothetical protein